MAYGVLRGSIGGMVVGVLLFFGSFFALWKNEGRVDYSQLAKRAKALEAPSISPREEGSLVSVTGELQILASAHDPSFLQPESILRLDRHVEMYAWVEERETRKLSNGDSITNYRYKRAWTASPASSSSFHEPRGHHNPPLSYQQETFYASQAQVGAYTFDPRETSLPATTALRLEKRMIRSSEVLLAGDQYLFLGAGTHNDPEVGDVRISYSGLLGGGIYTVFGQKNAQSIVSYYDKATDVSLLRLLKGTREEALSALATEYQVMGWVVRVIGFLMMWMGMLLFLGPLSTVLSVIPFLGTASRFVVSIVTLPIAVVLSLLTIGISLVAHHLLLLLIPLGILVGVGIWRYLVIHGRGQVPSSNPSS